MSRQPTGQILVREGARGRTFALRYRAAGRRQYETLGTEAEGWTLKRAEEELENRRAAIRLGVWQPSRHEAVPVFDEPTLHEFASEWFAAREAEGLAAKTLADLKWSLSNHLLPHFASYPLSTITVQEVDRYKTAKAAERQLIEESRGEARKRGERFTDRGLSNGSINHTLRHLAQILETAVEYGLISSNPATGRRRRLKTSKPARPWVEPEQFMALIEATAGVGRALVSLLAGAGLRIGEALALRWQDVDLGTGTIYVRDAKTPKGVREVHLTPALREAIVLWKADATLTGQGDYVVQTSTGRKHNPSNLRRDVLSPAVDKANTKLAEVGIATIGPITFHSLRRTYASLRCACGDDVRYTADQLGHEDPRFTLRVYAQATKRRDRLAKTHRDAYDRALDWARMGTSDLLTIDALRTEATRNPA